MEAKAKRNRKPTSVVIPSKKTVTRPGKVLKPDLPNLVVGREVVGREISVSFVPNEWVDGTVNNFNEANETHEILYKRPVKDEKAKSKEWLCLGKTKFKWPEKKNFKCSLKNPTYSQKHTPTGDSAKDARVKVYWTAMGRWYQGVVESFDHATGAHQVQFRDGDNRPYTLHQEAVVWMDIPELATGTALKKMRETEGQAPLDSGQLSNDENCDPKAKPTQAATASVNTSVSRKRRRVEKAEANATPPKVTRRVAAKARMNEAKAENKVESLQPADGPKTQPSSHKPLNGQNECLKVSDSHGKGAIRADAGSVSAGQTHIAEPSSLPELVRRLQTTKSASSSSEKEPTSPGKSSGLQAVASSKLTVKSPGINVKVYTQDQCQLPDGASLERANSLLKTPAMASRKQRAECINGTSSPKVAQNVTNLRPIITKVGSKLCVKGILSPKNGKPVTKLCRNSAELQFVRDCEAIKGSRISFFNPCSGESLKGEVMGYAMTSRTLKIKHREDAGLKTVSTKNLVFHWVTPRAIAAGASADLHKAFQSLGAANAGEPYLPRAESPGVVVTVRQESLSPEEGLHPSLSRPKIDIPEASQVSQLTPSNAAATQQSSQTAVQSLFPTAQISTQTTGLVQPPQAGLTVTGGAASVSLVTVSERAPAHQPSSILGSLQAASCQPPVQRQAPYAGASEGSSSAHGIQNQDGQPARGPAAGAAAYRKPQQAATSGCKAFVGWIVSIRFRGDGKDYEGKIIAYNPKTGKHRLLYADGEDEWLVISDEPSIKWLRQEKNSGYVAAVPEGMVAPSDRKDWEKWRIGIYWENEGIFYPGTVCDPDDETSGIGQLKIHYDDGEERFENVDELICKLLEPPPNCQSLAVGDAKRKARVEGPQRLDTIPYPMRQPSKKKFMPVSEPVQEATYVDSGKGRLLQFVDEEPVSPASQLPLSPRQCMGFGSQRLDSFATLPSDPRGPPALERRINGLKHPQGYMLPHVKKLRVWLPKPPSPSENAKQGMLLTDEVPTVASRAAGSLKSMLDRTAVAQRAIANGMPLGSQATVFFGGQSLASLPSSRPSTQPSEQTEGRYTGWVFENGIKTECIEHDGKEEKKKPESLLPVSPKSRPILSATPPTLPDNATPPRSPFSGVKDDAVCAFSEDARAQNPATILTRGCLDSTRADDQQASMSLPQTPSAKFEKVHRRSSRSGSDLLSSPPNIAECCAA